MKGSAGMIVERWLYQTLAADPIVAAALGTKIHRWPAPTEWTYPLLVYFKESAEDFGPIGGPATSAVLDFRVAVMVRGHDTSAVEPAVDRINELLDGGDHILGTSGLYITSQRTGELSLETSDDDDEEVYTQIGGTYQIMVGQGA
jgi:hypothetical protein